MCNGESTFLKVGTNKEDNRCNGCNRGLAEKKTIKLAISTPQIDHLSRILASFVQKNVSKNHKKAAVFT